MPETRLKATLIGPDENQGEIEFDEFRKFCNGIAQSLQVIENRVAPNRSVRYRLIDLKKSSATVVIEPIPSEGVPDSGKEIVHMFSETVSNLQNGRPVDPRFDTDDLMTFRALARPLNGRRQVQIDGTLITSQFVANIDQIIKLTIPSDGSVKGRLEKLNVHGKNEFVIYPPYEGYSISCSFPEDLFPLVRQAIKQNVTVFGRLVFKPDRP